MRMFRYVVLLSAAIISLPVTAQADEEMECGMSANEAVERLNGLFTRLDEVSRPAMDFGKLDDKVVRQICNAAQGTLQQATSIRNAPLANNSCSNAEVRKMADVTIKLAKSLLDQQKCQ
jgi:hypothetical protein